METQNLRSVKVAVVGSGLAGLTAAHFLATHVSKDVKFDVHIFEKADELGMDAQSISVAVSPNRSDDWRVDVPMRSFQGGYYPRLIRLYQYLGVQFRRADFSYSFADLSDNPAGRSITTRMIYNGASGRAGVSMPSSLHPPKQFNSSDFQHAIMTAQSFFLFIRHTLILLFNYVWLVILSAPYFRPYEDITFSEWVTKMAPKGPISRFLNLDRQWHTFCDEVVVPLFSCVCTAAKEDILLHPAAEFLEYIWLTLFTHHYVVSQGVRDVVARLANPVSHIHTSSTITSIVPDANDSSKLTLGIRRHNSAEEEILGGFSHIIFATQANSAVPILSSYSNSLPISSAKKQLDSLIQCLKTFQYRKTIVINHTDSSVLPHNTLDWRDLNIVNSVSTLTYRERTKTGKPTSISPSPSDTYLDPAYTMATHKLTKPSWISPQSTYYQTTNPIVEIDPQSVISVARLERAVVTVESKRSLQQLMSEEKKWWWPRGKSIIKLGKLQGLGGHDPENDGKNSEVPGIWICGSYAHSGIPLLEGCVVSALQVAFAGIMKREGVENVTIPF